jgi:Asp-tRNA(Asn)/Glu-tRNA(Gln) amidotransferase C subunit
LRDSEEESRDRFTGSFEDLMTRFQLYAASPLEKLLISKLVWSEADELDYQDHRESMARIAEGAKKLREDPPEHLREQLAKIDEEDKNISPAEADQNRAKNLGDLRRRICKERPNFTRRLLLDRLENPSPDQLCEIAEYVEELDGKEAALPFWEKAAEAGNEGALAYMLLAGVDGDVRPEEEGGDNDGRN